MKAFLLPLIILLTCLALVRSHAIDLQPPPSGNGVSDVYESLYPGLIYNDDPLTGDVCLPIREDITVRPYTNREKALLGVAPTVSVAMPLSMEIHPSGTAVTLRFPTVRGKRYQVQRGEVVALSESQWITVQECGGPVVYKSKMVRTPVGAEIIGTGTDAVVNLPMTRVPGQAQYFSYTCLGDIFSDTDALSDWEESILGTNPGNPDTDGDGLLDDWEYVHTGKFGIWPSTISLRLPRNQTANTAIHLSNDTTSPVNYSVTLAGNAVPFYSFEDSVSGTVAYTWEEISTTGTKLEYISNIRDGSQPVDLSGFTFPFYGNTFNRVHVSNNGFVTFGTPSSSNQVRLLPSSLAPANLIAAFWADLDTRTIGDIYYKEESNRVIIQYQNVGRAYWGSYLSYTFQIVLFADGRIQYRYKSMGDFSESAIVGIQNSNGTMGYALNNNGGPYVANQMAVEIKPQSIFLNVASMAGTVPAKATFSLNALFRSLQLPFGTYTATITTAHNASDVPGPHTTTATLEVFNAPATVALTAPANGTAVLQGDNITLSASATDPEGMDTVEFYNGSTRLFTAYWSPYSWTWYNPPVGTHTLTARAIDIVGGSTTSAPVTVTVLADADGDRMADVWESAHALNPGDPSDAYADADGDRIPSLWEYIHGTNPLNSGSKPAISAVVAADGTGNYQTMQQAYYAQPDGAIIEVRSGVYGSLAAYEKKRIHWLANPSHPTQPVKVTSNSAFTACVQFDVETAFYGFVFDNCRGTAISIASPKSCGFINCLFTGNSGRTATALSSNQKAILIHCTLVGNYTVGDSVNGNATIHFHRDTLLLRNCIVWNPHISPALPEITTIYGTVSAINSIIRGGQFGGINQAPALAKGGWVTSLSPARQAGAPGWSARDIHGEARPTTPPPDIGWDQFVDQDSDSLPDWWETHYFGNLSQGPQNDSDTPVADGLTNRYEFQFGFDPTLSDTLGSGRGDLYMAVFSNHNDYWYPPDWKIDADGDGLTNAQELYYGTNPDNPDSNGDGFRDAVGLQLQLSSTNPDPDGDTLTNTQEAILGTNPLYPDTDGDGVADNLDVFPLDPTRWQTPPGDAGDTTAPAIHLTTPKNAIPL